MRGDLQSLLKDKTIDKKSTDLFQSEKLNLESEIRDYSICPDHLLREKMAIIEARIRKLKGLSPVKFEPSLPVGEIRNGKGGKLASETTEVGAEAEPLFILTKEGTFPTSYPPTAKNEVVAKYQKMIDGKSESLALESKKGEPGSDLVINLDTTTVNEDEESDLAIKDVSDLGEEGGERVLKIQRFRKKYGGGNQSQKPDLKTHPPTHFRPPLALKESDRATQPEKEDPELVGDSYEEDEDVSTEGSETNGDVGEGGLLPVSDEDIAKAKVPHVKPFEGDGRGDVEGDDKVILSDSNLYLDGNCLVDNVLDSMTCSANKELQTIAKGCIVSDAHYMLDKMPKKDLLCYSPNIVSVTSPGALSDVVNGDMETAIRGSQFQGREGEPTTWASVVATNGMVRKRKSVNKARKHRNCPMSNIGKSEEVPKSGYLQSIYGKFQAKHAAQPRGAAPDKLPHRSTAALPTGRFMPPLFPARCSTPCLSLAVKASFLGQAVEGAGKTEHLCVNS
ncbi:hypothetical protein U1Q18_014564 [Sarracenia purpurea var. burkii]